MSLRCRCRGSRSSVFRRAQSRTTKSMTRRCLAAACVLLSTSAVARAQPSCADVLQEELVVRRIGAVPVRKTLAQIRQRVVELEARLLISGTRAADACVIAELYKRLGSARARTFYETAIREDPSRAEYRLAYGDWLRAYRGPGQPLVRDAAREYCAGLQAADTRVQNLIRRSLISLYERDGLSLGGPIDGCRTMVFFSHQAVGTRSPDDLGAVDTIRTLTAAARFSGSAERLGHPLTSGQLGALVRNDWRGQTTQRFRLRTGTAAVDAFLDARGGIGSQVTSYYDPTSRGNVTVLLGGVGVEEVVGTPVADFLVRGDLRWGARRGLIEFTPNADESIRSFAVRGVASRFVGPNKLHVEFVAGHDDVTQQVAEPIARDLDVRGITFRYQIFGPLWGSRPYERPIASRGSEVFVGRATRSEAFGTVNVDSTDLFLGLSLKGLPGGGAHTFDLTVQPTLYDYGRRGFVKGKPAEALSGKQWETFGTVLYRVIDHENDQNVELLPPLVFLNIVGLASLGTVRDGPMDFERVRFGAQLDAKIVAKQLRGGTTFLASGRYELQRFGMIAKRAHVAYASVGMGF